MRGLLILLACVPAFAVWSSRNGARSCGRAAIGPEVQNGESIPIETVPWHAGIFIERDGNYTYACGGTLVSPCIVVTAAHCVSEKPRSLRKKIFVALGTNFSSWDSESGENVHKVKNGTVHPSYLGVATKLAYNIAVLELDHCSNITDKIIPICMDKNIQPLSSANLKVAGWGNGTTPLPELRSTTLKQLNHADCLEAMSTNLVQVAFVTHDKFCATAEEGVPESRLRVGDSGGGGVVWTAGSWYMMGVVTGRLKSGENEEIYTLVNVSEYLDWIQQFIRYEGDVDSSAYADSQGTCGRAVAGPASLVQNGEKTPIETVPWHAGIYIERDGRIENICGGSLVSPCVVVTAAHCITDGKMYVALGKYLSGWDSESGKNIHKTEVKKVTVHRHYRRTSTKLVFDIAVLELEKCSPINANTAPVCMDKDIQPVSSADIKVAGWGNETNVLTELESVTLTQLNFEDCLDVMSNAANEAYVTTDKFCARRRKGAPQSGLLTGDSGGAALVKQGGSWYMTGVVSSRLKDENNEDVYALTKVSEYVDWIREFVTETI